MGIPLAPLLRTGIWVVLLPLFLYVTFLGLGATPFFQRHFLYAHRINTLFWHDVDKPEQWGFAKNQVTPFSIPTSDGETLYAWHILPLPAYQRHEAKLIAQDSGFAHDITTTEAFNILKRDPEKRLVIYFHGNAGHVANGWRPGTYHALTDATSYHVITVDYRGFGRSTGIPSEEGLIRDARAVVDWAISVAEVPPERIIIFGHSLGTGVASGLAEACTSEGIEFAGIVLVASFSDLPAMLSGYRISGWVPVLAPFWRSPALLAWVSGYIWDTWPTAERLVRVVQNTKTRLRLTLIHARNDWDIPCQESDKVFRAIANATVAGGLDQHAFDAWKDVRTVWTGKDSFITTWTAEPNIVLRQEQFPYGGHNEVMQYAPVTLAIMRSFDLDNSPLRT